MEKKIGVYAKMDWMREEALITTQNFSKYVDKNTKSHLDEQKQGPDHGIFQDTLVNKYKNHYQCQQKKINFLF